jgi:hypothetical protein
MRLAPATSYVLELLLNELPSMKHSFLCKTIHAVPRFRQFFHLYIFAIFIPRHLSSFTASFQSRILTTWSSKSSLLYTISYSSVDQNPTKKSFKDTTQQDAFHHLLPRYLHCSQSTPTSFSTLFNLVDYPVPR